MTLPAILLSLAALGGATLAVIRLRGVPRPPTWMALGHGVVAAAGVVTLAYAAYTPGIPRHAQIALGVVVLAALGGAAIFLNWHLKGRPLPIPLVLGHGVTALVGLALLWLTIYRGG
jgi:hypothetical protein